MATKPKGYMIRVGLSEAEYWELRGFATKDRTSVTAILAQCARKWLDKRRRKENNRLLSVGENDNRADEA